MVRVAIVAPARRLAEASAQAVTAIAQSFGDGLELIIHPQCYESFGHFAGTDEVRLEAFVSVANDPSIDAVWFARGGYGSGRLLAGLDGRLDACAREKVYLGYSDLGFLLSALTGLGCCYCAHGPMPGDVVREGGEVAIARALSFLTRQPLAGTESVFPEGLDADCEHLALNLTILRSLLGTPYLPTWTADKAKRILWLEDVGEYVYATDRSMCQLVQSDWFKALSGVRIGRFSAIPENDVPFHQTSAESVAAWCAKARVPVLGDGDIGHDAHNKIVPFGRLQNWRSAGLL